MSHPLTPLLATILREAGVPNHDRVARWLFDAGIVGAIDLSVYGHDPHRLVAHLLERTADAAAVCHEGHGAA